jgi:hypothetical protein
MNEVIDKAIAQLKEEKPELTLQIESCREALYKVGEVLLNTWDKIKEKIKEILDTMRKTIQPALEAFNQWLQENDPKQKSYKTGLHEFLQTNKFQTNFTNASNIYYKGGRNFNISMRRN